MGHEVAKTITRHDGQRRVLLLKRSDGLFSYFEEQLIKSYDGTRCWTPVWPSEAPLCDSLETAAREARARIGRSGFSDLPHSERITQDHCF